MLTLETDRLLLRPLCLADLDDMVRLYDNPVMRAYRASEPADREPMAKRLDLALRHWERHGFGTWALVHRSDQRFIGWCGVSYRLDAEEPELGYTVASAYWGQGLATEAARAVMRFAFEQLRLRRVAAHARIENVASQRVLCKVGMLFERYAEYSGKKAVRYTMENPRGRTGTP